MITQRQQDMIDAAKSFLIEFEETLSGTRNDMLNCIVEASKSLRREIVEFEEDEEAIKIGYSCNAERQIKESFYKNMDLRQVIKDEHEIRYGESVCVRNDQPFLGFIGE